MVVAGQTIAGRHIARAKNLRKVLNLTVGDFMDFEEALEKGMRCTGSESPSVAETVSKSNDCFSEVSFVVHCF